ncbi:MAG: hypothetical protein ACRDDX_14415 [Cellulosilyticaceae bacterium]
MKKIQIVEGIMSIVGKIGRFLSKLTTNKKNQVQALKEELQAVQPDKIEGASVQEASVQEVSMQVVAEQQSREQQVVGNEAWHKEVHREEAQHKKDNKGVIIPLHRYRDFVKVQHRKKTWLCQRKELLHQREPTWPSVRIDIKGTGT